MDSSEVLDQFRTSVSDDVEPFLWSDAEAFRYMDEAQKMFCRLTGGLGDASSPLTRIDYTTATDWVDLSPLILKVRDATRVDDGREITIENFEDLRATGRRFNGVPNRVRSLVTGIEPHRARLHPFPREAGSINLVVDRLPLKPITDAGGQKFEIDEQHHMALISWMRYRAYAKQDAETLDKKKSEDSKAEFEVYCFEAKAEKELARTKNRMVHYGGY